MQVDIISSTAEDHRAWFGFCESRLRLLVNGLEAPDCGVQCYPFSRFYHNEASEQSKSNTNLNQNDSKVVEGTHVFISSFFIALRFAQIESIDLKQNTLEFSCIVNSWEDRKAGMDLVIKHVLQKDLPSYVHEIDGNEDTHAASSSPYPMKRARRPAPTLNL